jgi:hypothetical protein
VNNDGLYGANNSVNNGAWHHLLHSFSRAGQAVTYLDGVQVDTRPISNLGSIDTGGTFSIGQDPTGTYSESGAADLDDMGIWRRALTPTEAYAIYYVGATYGKSFNSYGPWLVTLTPSGTGNLILTWQGGTLVQSTSVSGPWTPVPGATPPNYSVTPVGAAKFYKIQP